MPLRECVRVQETAQIDAGEGYTPEITVELTIYYPPTSGSPFAAMTLVDQAAEQAKSDLLTRITDRPF